MLREAYGEARCGLDGGDPFRLLTMAILSAQCTDRRVNEVSVRLFEAYGDVYGMAGADEADVARIIYPLGLSRVKAANVVACARIIVGRHGGRVPGDLDSLTSLPGVGRKTANLMLGEAFGIPAFVVDTHVARLCGRLGLCRSRDPLAVEAAVTAALPKEEWVGFGHRLIMHGRAVCRARSPKCGICPISGACPSYAGMGGGPGPAGDGPGEPRARPVGGR